MTAQARRRRLRRDIISARTALIDAIHHALSGPLGPSSGTRPRGRLDHKEDAAVVVTVTVIAAEWVPSRITVDGEAEQVAS